MTPSSQTALKGLEAATHFQQSASRPSHSAWVSANAGSGKTYVLVNRIIRLMLAGSPLEKILCLTFTKAAAAEMSNRLFERLSFWVSLEDEGLAKEIMKITGETPDKKSLPIARRLFARSLETPGGLKIQTIHGFCESLLQRFPIEAGLSPGFEVMEEAEARSLKQEARNRVLAYAMENRSAALGEALANIVARVEGDLFDELLNHFSKARQEFVANEGNTSPGEKQNILSAQVDRLLEQIGLESDATQEELLSEFFYKDHFDLAKYQQALEILAGGSVNDKKSSHRLELALGEDDQGKRFDLLDAFFSRQDGQARTPSSLMTKKAQSSDMELAEWLFGEQERFTTLKTELKKITFFETNRSLYLLADAIHTAYQAAKISAGKLDFDDLISHTRTLFKRVSGAWVLYKIDGGIDHILVDEAQDTSAAQWQIIRTIAEEFFAGESAHETERTLFAVGDEKQSIYSFQGADPDQFDKMRKYFETHARHAQKEFRAVPLSVSFRSTRQVLGLVDRIFSNEAAASGLTHSGDIDTHLPTRTGQAGRVEFWETIKPVEGDKPDPWEAPLDWVSRKRPEHVLARKIARKIRQFLDQKEELPARGRPIEPGDILILVRKRGVFFEAMLRALKAHNIPVSGADRMILSDQIAIMDLVALGQVMLLTNDDLTLACVLKSPFFGLSEEDLFELAYDRGAEPLWHRLRAKYREIYQTLNNWQQIARNSSVFDFYSFVLNKEKGRKKLVSRLGEDSNDPIDEFLSLALTYDQSAGGSLQEFLHRFSRQDVTIKRDMEHGKNEVRLMTVHGAKGLEGNIVFLPETCSVPRRGGIQAGFTSLGEEEALGGLPVWAMSKAHHFERITNCLEKDREDVMAEYRRLLYVALTRARDRLYICGFESTQKRPENCWYDLIKHGLGDDAQEFEDEEGAKVWCLEDEQTAKPYDKETFETNADKSLQLPDWSLHSAPEKEYPPKPLVPSRLDWDEEQVDRPLDQTALSPLPTKGKPTPNRFRRGTLIHQLLQYLPELHPSIRYERGADYLALNAKDFTEPEHTEMIDQVRSILDQQEFKNLFSPSSKAEVPISALIEPEGGKGRKLAINGQIDRLVVDDHNVLIVDYKTNRPPPKKQEDVAPLYVRQMAAYRLILKKIYPQHKIRCALLWTDEPRLMELSENLLENALKRHTDT